MFILRADAVCDVCLDPYSEDKSPAVIRCGQSPRDSDPSWIYSEPIRPPNGMLTALQATFSAGLHLSFCCTHPSSPDRASPKGHVYTPLHPETVPYVGPILLQLKSLAYTSTFSRAPLHRHQSSSDRMRKLISNNKPSSRLRRTAPLHF